MAKSAVIPGGRSQIGEITHGWLWPDRGVYGVRYI